MHIVRATSEFRQLVEKLKSEIRLEDFQPIPERPETWRLPMSKLETPQMMEFWRSYNQATTGDVMKRAASRGRILTFEKGPQIILTRKPVAPGKNEDGKSQMSVMTTLGYFTDVEDPASIPGTASNPPRDVSLLVSTSTAPEPPLRTHTTSDEPTMILSRPEIPEIKDITPTAGQAQPPTQPPSYPRENGGRWVDAKDLCVGDRVELDELDALDPKGRWTLQTAVRYGVTLR